MAPSAGGSPGQGLPGLSHGCATGCGLGVRGLGPLVSLEQRGPAGVQGAKPERAEVWGSQRCPSPQPQATSAETRTQESRAELEPAGRGPAGTLWPPWRLSFRGAGLPWGALACLSRPLVLHCSAGRRTARLPEPTTSPEKGKTQGLASTFLAQSRPSSLCTQHLP